MAEGVTTLPAPARTFSSGPVQSIESTLTPQEMELVNYHRKNIRQGTTGRDPSGGLISVYSNTIQVPEGRYKGQYTTVPGWFGGQTVTDEDALWKQWGGEVNAGKWPVYANRQVAYQQAKHIHEIMDLESQ